jgi:hypothetical protein
MDVTAPPDERALLRTAKSCGPDAPTLASSWREATFADDGGKKARSPGRVRRKPLKPFAQGRSDEFGVPVVTILVWFFHFHARLRVHRAPGFPCALFNSEGRDDASLGWNSTAGTWRRVSARISDAQEAEAVILEKPPGLAFGEPGGWLQRRSNPGFRRSGMARSARL